MELQGFLITCLKCNSTLIRIEVRQDGIDFQCQSCKNKLLLRAGEVMKIEGKRRVFPDVSQQEAPPATAVAEAPQGLENTPKDDWPKDVLEKWMKEHPEGERP